MIGGVLPGGRIAERDPKEGQLGPQKGRGKEAGEIGKANAEGAGAADARAATRAAGKRWRTSRLAEQFYLQNLSVYLGQTLLIPHPFSNTSTTCVRPAIKTPKKCMAT